MSQQFPAGAEPASVPQAPPAWGPQPSAPWPGQAPAQPPAVQRTNGMAVASLVTGILGIVLAAVPLGIVALSQIRRTGEKGRGFAITGLVLSAVWTLLGILITILVLVAGATLVDSAQSSQAGSSGGLSSVEPADEPVSAVEPVAPTAEFVDVNDLSAGDCVTQVPDGVDTVERVGCQQQHAAEVFAVTLLADGAWPGEDQVVATSEESCLAEFAGYVGLPYEQSVFLGTSLYPSEDTWAAGDRTVICLLEDPAGATTGSALGSGR